MHDILNFFALSPLGPSSGHYAHGPLPVSSAHSVDPARLVCYAPRALDQLVVVTETARLLKFSASSGQLLSEVSNQQWKLRKMEVSVNWDKTNLNANTLNQLPVGKGFTHSDIVTKTLYHSYRCPTSIVGGARRCPWGGEGATCSWRGTRPSRSGTTGWHWTSTSR